MSLLGSGGRAVGDVYGNVHGEGVAVSWCGGEECTVTTGTLGAGHDFSDLDDLQTAGDSL